MKKLIYLLSLILAFGLFSCGTKTADNAEGATAENVAAAAATKTPAEMIAGVWKLGDMDMGMEIPAEQKAGMDAMMNKMKELMKYTFNADGTMEMVGPDMTAEKEGATQTQTAKWSLNADGTEMTVVTTLEGGATKEEKMKVEITEGKIVMKLQNPDDPKQVVTTTLVR